MRSAMLEKHSEMELWLVSAPGDIEKWLLKIAKSVLE